MDTNTIPNSFSEITIDYLNEILSKELSSKIISFTKGEKIEEGYTGEINRIIPIYEKEINTLPKSLIIKLATKNKGINKLLTETKGYEKEIKLYSIFSKYKNLNLPKIYFSNINQDKSKFILIMEDLKNRNLKQIKLEEGFDINFSYKIIDFYSKLQSLFWNIEKHSELKFIEEYNFSLYLKDLTISNFDKRKENFIKQNTNLLNEDTINLIRKIDIKKLYELTNPINKKNLTLLHGDSQLSNLFYDNENIIMIDWQYSSIGIGLKDVIIILGISLEGEYTKDDIEKLKKNYYDKLINFGVQNYSFNEFNIDWNNCLLLSFSNIISAFNEENIGDDIQKKNKYFNYLNVSSKRFINFIQNQNL